jgi:hypothetical protein
MVLPSDGLLGGDEILLLGGYVINCLDGKSVASKYNYMPARRRLTRRESISVFSA